jgi:hypothetical protein
MVKIDISSVKRKLFSVDVDSISTYRRNEKLIEEMLQQYIWEFETEQVMDEMKQKVELILKSDIKNIRKEKLKRISDIYNLPKYRRLSDCPIYIDIKFVIGNEFNFD